MKWLDKTEEALIAVAIMVSTVIIFANVVMRNFGAGISWSEELVRYLFVLITFIGASVCVRKGAHLCVDVLPSLLSDKYRHVLMIIINLVSLIFVCVLTWLSAAMVQFSYTTGQLSPAIRLPIYVVYAVIFIGALLMVIRYIHVIILVVRGQKTEMTKKLIS